MKPNFCIRRHICEARWFTIVYKEKGSKKILSLSAYWSNVLKQEHAQPQQRCWIISFTVQLLMKNKKLHRKNCVNLVSENIYRCVFVWTLASTHPSWCSRSVISGSGVCPGSKVTYWVCPGSSVHLWHLWREVVHHDGESCVSKQDLV